MECPTSRPVFPGYDSFVGPCNLTRVLFDWNITSIIKFDVDRNGAQLETLFTTVEQWVDQRLVYTPPPFFTVLHADDKHEIWTPQITMPDSIVAQTSVRALRLLWNGTVRMVRQWRASVSCTEQGTSAFPRDAYSCLMSFVSEYPKRQVQILPASNSPVNMPTHAQWRITSTGPDQTYPCLGAYCFLDGWPSETWSWDIAFSRNEYPLYNPIHTFGILLFITAAVTMCLSPEDATRVQTLAIVPLTSFTLYQSTLPLAANNPLSDFLYVQTIACMTFLTYSVLVHALLLCVKRMGQQTRMYIFRADRCLALAAIIGVSIYCIVA